MQALRKIEVTSGVWWVEAPAADLRILCGCPADAVKHLMKRGLIAPTERDGVSFETGPNAILLSDVMIQNGSFANLGEFPVLQMLYRQGMIVPGHPGNTGGRPLLIGSAEQVHAQLQYIHRGNYGLLTEQELVEAGLSAEEAREQMRLKLKFAFGAIRHPGELLDSLVVEGDAVPIRHGATIRRLRLNVFEIAFAGDSVVVDLGLPPFETYECPYPLGFYHMPREYFAVVHSGEGDGWDINRPSMGSVLMYQGRVFLIDAGPNILHTLDSLGIGINEIEGIFHTHSHDDHFAGLTTLIRADHRIKYYATPPVRASVAKKLGSLLTINDTAFADYFDVHDLVCGEWNEIEGLEVRPMFSPHPVETTTFLFRALWEDGFRTYAHLADICRLEVLRGFLTDAPGAPGLSQARYDRVVADMLTPADIKKVDVGGGMIHGDAYDFREDKSGKIILAHTSRRHTIAQKAIGSTASFGTVDVLIPSNHDFIWRFANEFLQAYFPSVAHHHLRVLMNNPVVTFNPGTILIKERRVNQHIYLLLSGSVEAIPLEHNGRSVLSAGAMIGELSGLFGTMATETYRAVGFVKALDIPVSLYSEFVHRHQLFSEIARVLENREFLQRTWLFGEVVSTQTLNRIAQEMILATYPADTTVDIGADSVGLVARGSMGRFLGEHRLETLEAGGFFGEEMSIFWTPSMFRLRTLAPTDVFLIPADLVSDIPSVRWKLFEASGKRMTAVVEGDHDTPALLRWHEDYRVDILRIDNQHRRLFEQGNAIVEAMTRGERFAEIEALLDALAEYARYHFGEEEAMMTRHFYPGLDAHRLRHAELLDQLDDLRAGMGAAEPPAAEEVERGLRAWLVAHIVDDDRRYARFMNDRGVF